MHRRVLNTSLCLALLHTACAWQSSTTGRTEASSGRPTVATKTWASLVPTDEQSVAVSSTTDTDTALSLLGTSLDVRRFDTLVHAGPQDFRGLVHEIPNDELDWNTTIFYTITDPQITERLKARFGKRPLWADSVIATACANSRQLPSRIYYPPPSILEFMKQNCEFKNEHADGNFDDHLSFCAEYTARYFRHEQASPNVLFLHSITGVNTNLFPMDFAKIPDLERLLTPHEFLHIQAFPCMLRLLFLELMDVLWDEPASRVELLDGITVTAFHGTPLTLTGEDFWIHLNYHLIHMLDFLPVQNFDKVLNDPFVRLFFRVHEFLRNHDKLMVDVRLERMGKVPGMAADGDPLPAWDHMLSKPNVADDVAKAQAQLKVQLRAYSQAIDHDLSYQLHWR